jgi:UDP-N-acetylglucosamine transferase subunit ALG13
MIFVTVGTTKFPFDRLLKQVDLDLSEQLIVQQGSSKYKFKHASKSEDFLSYGKMIKYFQNARVAIIHAGVGSYLMARKHFSGLPIVVPRLKIFNEHVSDHQLMLADYLRRNHLGIIIKKPDKLKQVVMNYESISEIDYISDVNSCSLLAKYLKKICNDSASKNSRVFDTQ